MNSESGREERAPESALDLLQRWKRKNNESAPPESALSLLQRRRRKINESAPPESAQVMNSESGPEAQEPEPANARAKREGPARDQKTTNSRRKEKRRRRANSLSVRRGG